MNIVTPLYKRKTTNEERMKQKSILRCKWNEPAIEWLLGPYVGEVMEASIV